MNWPASPLIYEISTWVWLNELSRKHGRRIDLGAVPHKEWDEIAGLGFDAVWLMGVWERSPAGREISRYGQGLEPEFRRVLPDYTPEDVPGSPYCVHRYVVDENLGGKRGLATARSVLADRGLRLMLDFVPNHVAPDHPWLIEHPDYFVRGEADDAARDSRAFFEYGGKVFARGRDPYFAPWPDTAQINAFSPSLRRAFVETLNRIAEQCDGVRCDMAMLMLNDVFQSTWGQRAGAPLSTELWSDVIQPVRRAHPEFLFLAEAYWDREWQLQQLGFDYCYDKRLYDRLVHGNAESVRLHLLAEIGYQEKLVRFLENHDEPRAAATFPPLKARAAAVVLATLPGAKLFYEGQLEGRKVKLPIQLGRRPEEPVDTELREFYRRLLKEVARDGDWKICERTGWPDNASCLNILGWCDRKGERRRLTVVNLSDSPSQARIHLPWDDLEGKSWRLADALSEAVYERDGGEMRDPGLFVDLPPWGYSLFNLEEL